MKTLKVMTVVGTRPEIIRLSAVIEQLEHADVIAHTLVHTGQNYDDGLSAVFFRDLGVREPHYFLSVAEGSAVERIGAMLQQMEQVLDEVQPDAFLVLGDTNSCLCALAAKRRHIPIFHMEAGNRCFDARVPEETNRKMVDHLADINLPYSDIARDYLLSEGFPADRIIKTGSPLYEVLTKHQEAIAHSAIVEQLGLVPGAYFVVSAHREENIVSEHAFTMLVDSIEALAERYGRPIIVSTHPRTEQMIARRGVEFSPLVRLLKPLGFFDYVKLQMEAQVVLSDSGTISEEANILGLRALNIREAHERPEAMEEAAVMMVGLHKERILQGVQLLMQEGGPVYPRPVADYMCEDVSGKVLRIILSYTDYVRRVVWREPV